MHILITDNCHPVLQQKFSEAGITFDIDTECTYQSLLAKVHQYDALVVRSKIEIDAAFLDQARHLRCIGRLGAGMETIDVDYAEKLGISCINSPEGNRDAVGEHAVGLLLSLLNHISTADAEVRKGLWRREANRGFELGYRTVGIVGFGNMGSSFAKRLQGFGCRILAYDKYKKGYAPSYVEEVSLQQLQDQVDVVSLHVPLTTETHHLVDEHFISSMTHPFYLVNTSRGAVVSTDALANAVRSQKVLGAALDVIEFENLTRDALRQEDLPPAFLDLLESPHMLFTPHVGGWTVESKYKLAAFLADKMITSLNN